MTAIDNINLLEKFHLKYLKYVLGLKPSTPTCMVYGETGFFPLSVKVNKLILKFWCKIVSDINSKKLSTRIYDVMYFLLTNDIYSCPFLVYSKNVLDKAGFSYIWLQQEMPVNCINSIVNVLQDQFIQEWRRVVKSSPKCTLYRCIKINFEFEPYLSTLSPYYRKILCKFRSSNHKLPIEVGRFNNLERSLRKCIYCNKLGDEYHFMLECNELVNLRKKFLPKFCHSNPNMFKLIKLLSTHDEKTLHNISIYIKKSMNVFKLYI